ncbi:unnamed protein product, partial [Acanthoscelides obtectus]
VWFQNRRAKWRKAERLKEEQRKRDGQDVKRDGETKEEKMDDGLSSSSPTSPSASSALGGDLDPVGTPAAPRDCPSRASSTPNGENDSPDVKEGPEGGDSPATAPPDSPAATELPMAAHQTARHVPPPPPPTSTHHQTFSHMFPFGDR